MAVPPQRHRGLLHRLGRFAGLRAEDDARPPVVPRSSRRARRRVRRAHRRDGALGGGRGRHRRLAVAVDRVATRRADGRRPDKSASRPRLGRGVLPARRTRCPAADCDGSAPGPPPRRCSALPVGICPELLTGPPPAALGRAGPVRAAVRGRHRRGAAPASPVRHRAVGQPVAGLRRRIAVLVVGYAVAGRAARRRTRHLQHGRGGAGRGVRRACPRAAARRRATDGQPADVRRPRRSRPAYSPGLGARLQGPCCPRTWLPAVVETVARSLRVPYVAVDLADGDGGFHGGRRAGLAGRRRSTSNRCCTTARPSAGCGSRREGATTRSNRSTSRCSARSPSRSGAAVQAVRLHADLVRSRAAARRAPRGRAPAAAPRPARRARARRWRRSVSRPASRRARRPRTRPARGLLDEIAAEVQGEHRGRTAVGGGAAAAGARRTGPGRRRPVPGEPRCRRRGRSR